LLLSETQRLLWGGIAGSLLALPLASCSKPNILPTEPPQFNLVSPQQGIFNDQANYQSTLESVRNVNLAAEISGRIIAMSMREGQIVQPGTRLFVLDQVQQRAQVNANAAEARKNLVNAERYVFLNNQGAVSTMDRDFYVTQAIQSADQLRADKATLGYKTVLAPIAGEVGNINHKLGDVVNQGETVVNIVDNRQLWVRLNVPGDLAYRVKLGLPVVLEAPDRPELIANGRVTFIAPSLDKQSQTLLVKATFNNTDGVLRNNQRVNAILRFASGSRLSIPEAAVLLQAGQSFVFLAVSAAEARQQLGRPLDPPPPAGSLVALQVPVTLGSLQKGKFAVNAGLKTSDRLLLGNLAQLRSGMAVPAK
jgi:RND family efflux transporter MFP subunit